MGRHLAKGNRSQMSPDMEPEAPAPTSCDIMRQPTKKPAGGKAPSGHLSPEPRRGARHGRRVTKEPACHVWRGSYLTRLVYQLSHIPIRITIAIYIISIMGAKVIIFQRLCKRYCLIHPRYRQTIAVLVHQRPGGMS